MHAHPFHQIPGESILAICRAVLSAGHTVRLSQSVRKALGRSSFSTLPDSDFELGESLKDLDIFLSLGGDGTMLDSLLYTVPEGVPTLGVNFGRMGFLASVQASVFEKVLQQITNGAYSIEKRTLLQMEAEDAEPLFLPYNFGLNEVSVTKRDTASMITIRTWVNDEFLNDYWGDGLIIATATGSTGYSLSCYGPVLLPESKGLVINPISPHNLSMRPLILPEEAEITLLPTGRSSKVMVSMDSRSKVVTGNKLIRIKASKLKAEMVKLPGSSFIQTLREKLFWGKDLRN